MKLLWEKFQNSHFSKFVFVGGLNTLVGYGSFVILILLNVQYVIASVISHILGVTNSYLWNKFFTFKKAGQSAAEVLRFVGVYTIQYLITLSALIVLVEVAELHPILAQGIILVITTLFSFFVHKYWTFKVTVDPALKDRPTIRGQSE